MPRYTGTPIQLVAGGQPFVFTPKALVSFPEAGAFLDGQLARGVAAHTAKLYTTHVARLRRQGRLNNVDVITDVTARTAANAYHRWVAENYSARIQPVHKLLVPFNLQRALPWLRCGSIVPPRPGKTVPQIQLVSGALPPLPDATGETWTPPATHVWAPCDQWTLHVPEQAVPAHTDPCETCVVLMLSLEQLEVIAVAFEKAWGHRNISEMPPDVLLFGEPPRAGTVEQTTALRVASIKTARDVDGIVDRLRGADVVHLSREACNGRLNDVLRAIGEAWTG